MGALLVIPAVMVGVVVTVALVCGTGAGFFYAAMAMVRSVLRKIPGIGNLVPDEPPTDEEIAQAKALEEQRQAKALAERKAELKEETRPKTIEDATALLEKAQNAWGIIKDSEVAALEEAKASGKGFQKVGELREMLAEAEEAITEAKQDLEWVQQQMAQGTQLSEGGAGGKAPLTSRSPAEFPKADGQSQSSTTSLSSNMLMMPGPFHVQYQNQKFAFQSMPPKAFNAPLAYNKIDGTRVLRLRGPAVARHQLTRTLLTAMRRI